MRGYFQPHGLELVAQNEASTYGLADALRIWAAVNMPDLGISLPNDFPPNVTYFGSFEWHTPYTASVELTDQCNASCRFCYRDSGPGNRSVLTNWSLLLDHLASAGVIHVQLTGGEPSLHPEFLQILKIALVKFDLVSVLTNGSRLGPEFVSVVRPHASKLSIQIDIDSRNPSIHDHLRGLKGLHNRVVRAARLLHSNNLRFRVAMNVVDANVNELLEVCEFAKSLGANEFMPTPILRIGRADNDEVLSQTGQHDLMRLITTAKNSFGSFVLQPSSECAANAEAARDMCGAARKCVSIAPNGDLRPCVLWPIEAVPLGNIERQTLHECQSGSVATAIGQLDAPGSHRCRACPDFSFCVGCIARAAIRSFDRRCWFLDSLIMAGLVGPVANSPPHDSSKLSEAQS